MRVSEPPDSGPLEIVPLGSGRFALVTAAGRRLAYAARSGGGTWVFLDGAVHLVQPAGAVRGRRQSRSDDEAALAAPMPATVVAVNVAIGQQVARGDVLVMLEAMKMELAIKAPRAGVVRAVACRAGELVAAGVPLIELE